MKIQRLNERLHKTVEPIEPSMNPMASLTSATVFSATSFAASAPLARTSSR